jgi:hypothetical protein
MTLREAYHPGPMKSQTLSINSNGSVPHRTHDRVKASG